MVNIINKLRGKDPSYIDFKRQQVLTVEQGEAQNPNAQEYIEAAAKAGLLISDQIATQVLLDNPSLSSLIPVLSPTNSVIKLNGHEADLKRIRLENHVCLLKLTMPPELYRGNGLEVLEGFRLYGHDRISGAMDGWIGHIATETTKVHRFEDKKR